MEDSHDPPFQTLSQSSPLERVKFLDNETPYLIGYCRLLFTNRSAPSVHYAIYMSWCQLGTEMIFDLCMFITLILIQCYRWKSAIFSFKSMSHHVSSITMAGITALCMSLNFTKYSHLKEDIREKNLRFSFKFNKACLFYMLVVLHFTNNSIVHSVIPILLRKYRFSS